MNITTALLKEKIPELVAKLNPDQIEEYRRLCHVYHNGGWSENGWYFDVFHSMKSEGCHEDLASDLALSIGLGLG